MSFPRYPKYKASGVEWLGDVPEHWEVVPLKHLCVLLKDGTHLPPARVDDGVPLLSVRNLVDGEFVLREDDSMIAEESYRELCRAFVPQAEDVLLAIVGATLGKTAIIPAGLGPIHIQRSLAIFRTRPEVVPPTFLSLVFQSHSFQSLLWELVGYSAQPGIYLGTLQNLRMPVPPQDEQTLIASFLDRETSKIDGLVGEQRRLIELLKEKRQAVISHAVTKGLNPHAPVKPSGIEWLGDVPEHWEIGSVKRFFTFLNGRRIPLSGEERAGRGGEFAYYGASGIIDWIDEFIFEEDLVLVSEDGANLINRSTSIAFVARGQYWVNNHAHILKPPDGNLIFWAERIESIDLIPFVTGSAQPKLTAEALNNLMIAVPPTESERADIEKHIVTETAKLDTLTVEAERGIELLQERRTALISAAVTGKIDVRGLVETGEAA